MKNANNISIQNAGVETFRFHCAGLEVSVSGNGSYYKQAGFYHFYPPVSEQIDLEITYRQDPSFPVGRSQSDIYPAFSRSLLSTGVVGVERYDAKGTIFLNDPRKVRAEFTLGDSKNSLEACIRIAASMALPRKNALILHASAIEYKNKALIFTGHSGAGKSTISTILNDLPGCKKVSDELLLLKVTDKEIQCLVSPFIGSNDLPHGSKAAIAGIHFLHQAPFHKRTAVKKTRALRELMKNVLVYVTEATVASKVLDLTSKIITNIPCYDLEFVDNRGVSNVLGISS